MPIQRPCLVCRRLTTNIQRCQQCQGAWQANRNKKRVHYQGDYASRAKRVRDTTLLCWICGKGSNPDDPWRFGFDPTPPTAIGGVMPCLGCLGWRCMIDGHPVVQSSRQLAQHDRLAKGLQGLSLCHRANKAAWSPVLALLVRRSHLGSELASCSGWPAMLLGIVDIVGCWL